MARTLTKCRSVALNMQQADVDQLLDGIDRYTKAGMSQPEAQRTAANELLASIEADRAEVMDAVRAQHPSLFQPLREPTALEAAADEIRGMTPEKRDNTEIGDFPGHAQGYALYEAQKMLPKPSNLLKRVTENNSFTLWTSYDSIANVDGAWFGITKQEDPDATEDESAFIYSFEPLANPRLINTLTSDVGELFSAMRAHKGEPSLFAPVDDFVERRNRQVAQADFVSSYKGHQIESYQKENIVGMAVEYADVFRPDGTLLTTISAPTKHQLTSRIQKEIDNAAQVAEPTKESDETHPPQAEAVALPDTEGAPVQPSQAEAERNIYGSREIPGSKALIFERIIVKPVRRGTILVPEGKVNSPADAAHAFTQLAKSPREKFQILALDAEDAPFAYYDLFAGTITQTSVYPREIFSHIYLTPGVKKIWIAHNHPSGVPAPSPADRFLTQQISQGFGPDIGVELAGHVIIAGDKAVAIDRNADAMTQVMPLSAPSYSWVEVPILENEIAYEDTETNAGLTISGPQSGRTFLNTLEPQETGILFMSAQHAPLSWFPITLDEMTHLRTGDLATGAARVLRQVGRANPASAILYGHESDPKAVLLASRNIGTLLKLADVQLIDTMYRAEGAFMSMAEKGLDFARSSEPFRMAGATRTENPATREELEGRLRQNALYRSMMEGPGEPRVRIRKFWDLPAHLINFLLKKSNGALNTHALFDTHDPRGMIYIIEGNVSQDEVELSFIHELVGHWGMMAVLPRATDVRGFGLSALDQVKNAYLQIYKERAPDIQYEVSQGSLRQYGFNLVLEKDRVNAASEWLAHKVKVGQEMKLWRRIVAIVRAAFRQLGVVKEWTDNDIARLFELSRESFERNGIDWSSPLFDEPFLSLPTPTGSTGPTTIYALDDNGRIKGLAKRPTGTGPWTVRITKGVPVDLLTNGKFKESNANTVTAVNQGFEKAGLRMVFGPPPNLPPSDRAVVESMGRAFDLSDTDPSRMLERFVHPRTIASFDADAAPVVLALEAKMEERDRIIKVMFNEQKSFFDLPTDSKVRVGSVLEYGRLTGQVFGTGTSPVTVTNTQFPEAGIPLGETVTLTDEEKSGYWAARRGMNLGLDMIREQMVRDFGLDPDVIATSDQVREQINSLFSRGREPTGDRTTRMRDLKRLAENLDALNDMQRTGYVPFSRWGEYAIVVKNEAGESIHYEKTEPVGSNVIATMGKEAVQKIPFAQMAQKAAQKRAEELRAKFPNATVLGPMHISRAESVEPVQLGMLDQLAKVSGLDQEQYKIMRDQLEEAQRKLGFRAHLTQSRNVPGYSKDFERAIADYTVGLATYLSRRRFNQEADNAIGRIPPHKRNLTRWARNYMNYTDTPQEELQALRQTGFLYYIAALPMTAAVNATQPWLTTWPLLQTFTDPATATAQLGWAYTAAPQMVNWSLEAVLDPDQFYLPEKAPDDVRESLTESWEKGIMAPMTTMEMMGIAGGRAEAMRNLGRRTRESIMFLAHIFMTTERTNRVASYIAAFRIASQPGARERILDQLKNNALATLTFKDAANFPQAFAEWIVDEGQFRTGKVNRAQLQRGPGTAILQFKDYPWQMVELYSRTAMLAGPKGKLSFALMLMTLGVISGFWGLPFFDNFRQLIEMLLKEFLDRDVDLKVQFRETVAELTGSARIAELVAHGAARSIDVSPEVSTRIGLGNILPTRPSEILGIPFDLLVNRAIKAGHYAGRGDYAMAAAQALPNFLKNLVEAEEWKKSGIHSATLGSTVVPPEDITEADIYWKRLGGRTRNISERSELEYAKKRQSRSMREITRQFYYKLATAKASEIRADREGNGAAELEALVRWETTIEEIRTYNADKPIHLQVIIDDRPGGALEVRVATELDTTVRDRRAPRAQRERRGELEELYNQPF